MHPDKKIEELQQKMEFEQEKELEKLESVEPVLEESAEKKIVLEQVINESTPLEIETEKRKKREAIFEMALFLILGILLGITIKTEAVKRITIGFNDYQISPAKNSYNISAIKKNLEDEAAAQQAAAQAAQAAQTASMQGGQVVNP